VISLDEKSKAFAAIVARLGLSQLGVNVVGVIVRNGRSAALPAFIKAVRARLAAHRGARTVEIVSAAPLDAAQLQTIVSGLSRVLGADVEPDDVEGASPIAALLRPAVPALGSAPTSDRKTSRARRRSATSGGRRALGSAPTSDRKTSRARRRSPP
jgi:hypothetical protein